MSNSFKVKKEGDKYYSTSLNFSECVGEGDTELEAIDKMSRKIMYIRDNYPRRFQQVVRENINKCLANGETPLGVYQGGVNFKRRF